MRRDKIVKAMMSAVVMVSMTAISAQAEGYGEEARQPEAVEAAGKKEACGDGTEEPLKRPKGPGEVSQEEEIEETRWEESGEEGEEEEREEISPENTLEGNLEEEAIYRPHDGTGGGPGEVEWQTEETEETTEYGPHVILEQETETEKAVQSYTDEDLYILAHAICGEGQCCPDEEQLYIGSVILNRKNHGAYPNTIEGVVFQRGQYACTWDGNYYREPTEANWRNARWLLENGSILPGNVVYQAGFRQGSGVYLQTRYHKYCYR